ncbi:nucleoside diphosphate kinase [Alkalibacterium putridalgicola]|uniref:Nucleoside diphosphate kinase n=1 Tax=Alkalibacterium putridalgicola TaxID=426703 RepID=A0A1H7S9E2_9LACT|nr:nucleoside-diphosphate kinase [Alkalibacterium putridalgicola]GEK89101.1 nucleoside-diphosphate kinase [Alkalibacterium putridalgicola]SEL68826.1 nucleoside diphosphate kinase [Alkalibacterium putridalgicola]
MEERTLVIIKPDGVERNLTGHLLKEFERNDLRISRLKMMQADMELARKHYAELADKPFFNKLLDYITRGPLVVCVIDGEEAVHRVRELVGDTDPKVARPNTIRTLYGKDKTENTIHASDSVESAEREMMLWFGELYEK